MSIATSPFYEELVAPVTTVTRRCDIYEADGATPFLLNAPLLDGTVTVDGASTESRRTLDCTLLNELGRLKRHPGGLWYDKVVKVYRGIALDDVQVDWQVGEFVIDKIARGHFPDTVKVTGRDYVKRLVRNKFGIPTTFSAGMVLMEVVSAIALNGGVSRLDLPSDERAINQDFVFEPDDNRWAALRDIATAYNYEILFAPDGVLTMRSHADPATQEPDFIFQTGDFGNLASYEVAVGDTRLYNDVVVTGEGVDPPVVGRAVDVDPNSPTNIFRIGTRTYRYNSGFITTQAQAKEVAISFLAVHSLEEYEISMESIVIPYLDVASVVAFRDPDPDPGQPVNFLLQGLTIPLGLGTMSATAKRVVIV